MAGKIEKITVPDIGGAEDVEVIEISVAPGDTVNVDDPLVTLEGDKASMDVPSPQSGVVESIIVKVGDKISEGGAILTLQVGGEADTDAGSEASSASEASEKSAADEEKDETKDEAKDEAKDTDDSESTDTKAATSNIQEVHVPDIGDAAEVDVIDVMVKAGDDVNEEDSIITLEGDKATMDVPAPFSGKVVEVKISAGDKASEGTLILTMETTASASSTQSGSKASAQKTASPSTSATSTSKTASSSASRSTSGMGFEEVDLSASPDTHAGPSARRLARELDINLSQIKGTGAKGRISKDDVKNFVKQRMNSGGGAGLALPAAPKVDFSKFGEVETLELSKIQKFSGSNLHRNWVSIPHVTQFDEADITDMEAFRQEQKGEAQKLGFKLTPLVFIMKAVVAAMKQYPKFNSSLDASGEHLIMKKYFNVGVAVDTPNGLVVPVLRNVDDKGLFDLAKELGEISVKARDVGLGLKEMQGGCFTISSLGGIGGTAFTPIINAPEVAILGVSRSQMKMVHQGKGEFAPRLMLPLSLSYDHRVIDGADAARFIVAVSAHLADMRKELL